MTRMHCTFLAPELSATSSIERGWIISGRPADDRPDPPTLLLGQGARLLDEDAIPHLALVGFVVGLQLLGHADHALVAGVAKHPLDRHHARLLHGGADHDALATLAHNLLVVVGSGDAPPDALHREDPESYVVGGGRRRLHAAPRRVARSRRMLGHPHRELKAQVEQLLSEPHGLMLDLLVREIAPLRRLHALSLLSVM